MAKKKSNVVVVDRDLYKAPVFRNLNGTAKTILFDFMMKRRIEWRKTPRGKEAVIVNNGEIEYCYSEAEDKGISNTKFNRGVDTLIECGFIDLVHQGLGGRKGDKNLYAISERWRDWGTESFIPAKRTKDTRKGVGFAAYWSDKKNIGIENDRPNRGMD